MRVYRRIKPLIETIDGIKRRRKSIGFVPTMGFLHDGHLSLIRKARRDTECVVVSIFINPIQFGPKEDFKKYPRDLKRDLELLRGLGVEIVFIPSQSSMYSKGFSTYVNVEGLTDVLCGASRPGHFKGVTTVVTKLFNIIRPDTAYFGQKDIQQAVVIKRMVNDLNMAVKIKVMPIVREKDGLAMSSRNIYLSPDERKQALSIYKSLKLAKELYQRGQRDSKKILIKMRDLILKEKDTKIDYISIVDMENLRELNRICRKAIAAVAIWVGETRLIDNIELKNEGLKIENHYKR